jgi:hypothetical protein
MIFAACARNLFLSALAAGCCGLSAAEPVVPFRDGGTGAWPDADPPLTWSATKNVKWRWDAPVFGTSLAGPILVGRRAITLAQPMTIVALDADTGEELWRRGRHLEQPAGDGDPAFALHAAIRRDHRIGELKSRLGRKRGIDSDLKRGEY